MSKSEIARKILEVVSAQTEVSIAEIKGGGKSTEIVDARSLTVFFLYDAGFYPTEIARILKRSAQAVRALLRNFGDRRKQSGKFFEMNMRYIGKQLENF